MANKTNFTPDEWAKLLESPVMAALAITAAEPSGLWGLARESLSSGWALVEARSSGPNELIKAVATDFGAGEGYAAARDEIQARLSVSIQEALSGSKPAEARDKAIAALRDAAAIVDARVPAEAAAFKDWLKQIAQHTADASREGGFLGLGGVQVSEAEKATLDEIARALTGPEPSGPGATPMASGGASMPEADLPPLYLEDFAIGRVYTAGPVPISADDIKAYARQFDPQPFHTDEELARSTFFQGLAASGWHTASLTMRLVVQALPIAGGVIGGGVDELRWPKPLRPGDQLRLEAEIVEVRLLQSKPGQGLVRVQTTTFNREGEAVQIMVANLIVPRRSEDVRPPALGSAR